MKNNLILGDYGENKAVLFLKSLKYKILDTKYKTTLGELDIVCFDKKEKYYVFVEVKTRTTSAYGLPREAVDIHKQNKIRLVATEYAKIHKIFNKKMRFDVVEILDGNITHIKNAF